ncbi:MAG: hypothetical protein AABZ13_04115 [Planctomycetota bacterium]
MKCIDRINAGSNTVTALQKNVKQSTVLPGQNAHLLKIGTPDTPTLIIQNLCNL